MSEPTKKAKVFRNITGPAFSGSETPAFQHTAECEGAHGGPNVSAAVQ